VIMDDEWDENNLIAELHDIESQIEVLKQKLIAYYERFGEKMCQYEQFLRRWNKKLREFTDKYRELSKSKEQ